ncbi:HEAT repeat domain-containing protein [Pedobacter sp. Leaf176]|uniref:HEAT repeat domain-containing protein n=1 Tax=Pedobacter sp. Leaf176 TaxID=1736286 RepID=UPI0006F617DF|nr:HEAT repeat domain-containing protein [Pedobacter sp. Leaf176]KQR69633.1 hypothetical protein ASF92_13025 [Pedobacter sp. Leaf176]
MNDPLKEFVEQNRAAFDELEAPAFNLERFKAQLNPPQEQKIKKLWPGSKWLIAASVLIAFSTAFLLTRENNMLSPTADMALNKTSKPEKKILKSNTEAEKVISVPKENRFAAKVAPKKLMPVFRQLPGKVDADGLYKNLSDSSSSSTRLAAILEIEKSKQMSNDILDRLAKTLNHDENSNVRLAALSVLEKYSYDAHVSTMLIHSLNTQSDPMVQLGLVNILGKMKNLNINDKLYALANDPNTFDAVKDEAYSILLKEDKL